MIKKLCEGNEKIFFSSLSIPVVGREMMSRSQKKNLTRGRKNRQKEPDN
jgi:hypothetical protein